MTINPITPTMSKAEWAESQGVDVRTVTRWLAADEIPDARKIGREWAIPAHAQRHVRLQAAPTPSTDLDTTGHVQDMSTTEPTPLGVLLTLDAAATQLGTTAGGIRRLGDAGHLVVGKFGPNGSLRVYLP